MKTISKAFFVVLGSLCLMLLPSTGNAQCVQCAPAPPSGWICVPAQIGGGGCTTDGGSCTLISPCTPGGDRTTGGGCAPKALSNPQLAIPDSIIREIGAADARLAVTLISLGKIKAEFSMARINLSTLEYTLDDVENQLTQPADSPYFKLLVQRVNETLAKDRTIVTYDVTIAENRGSNSFTLNVSPAGKSGAAVELVLQRATFGEGKNLSEGFKAISYQIR